jgi:putative transposase
MFGCQQNLIHPTPDIRAVLEFICGESNKLHNCGTYLARQIYFKTGRIVGSYELHRELAGNPHFGSMYSQVAQQCLTSVAESFRSFKGLMKAFSEGKIPVRPRVPGYRGPGLHVVTYPKQAIKLKGGLLRFPLGKRVKTWFGIDSFTLPMPDNLDFKDIREYRILPRHGTFYLELVYKKEVEVVKLDPSKIMGIDHGVNNWLTCVTSEGTSFIIDGLKIKSMNQWYNKRVSVLKEGKPQGFWSQQLASITEKRNRQMRDGVNKAARRVINHCLKNKIGTIIFGWNKGQKDGANMGRKTNQKFVQIPTGKLKDRIAQLCEQYGIKFIETEESYTSKTSFLDLDFLPTFGEKPEGWKSSGRRVERGLFVSGTGKRVNSDCNGAANIIRKVAAMSESIFDGVSRGVLTAPLRIRLWVA